MWRNPNTLFLPEVCADSFIQKNNEIFIIEPTNLQEKRLSK